MNFRKSQFNSAWMIATLLVTVNHVFAADPALGVEIVGRKNESDLEFTTQLTTHTQTIPLRSIISGNLTVSSTQSSGPDGVHREVKVSFVENGTETIAVKNNDRINLKLTTEVPLVGTYRGVITLDGPEGKTKDVAFKITRAAAVFAYELLPKENEAVRQDLFWRSNTAKVRYSFHEKNGKAWKGRESQSVPELIGLTTKISDKTPYQTVYKKAGWVEGNGNKPFEQKIELEPGETKDLILNVSGIRHAGEHIGTLSVTNTDGQREEYQFTIYARRNFLFAVLAIGLGIGGSLFLRFLGSRRTRLNLQIRLAPIYHLCDENLKQTHLDQRSRAIFMHLKERIHKTFSTIETSPSGNYEEVISELKKRRR